MDTKWSGDTEAGPEQGGPALRGLGLPLRGVGQPLRGLGGDGHTDRHTYGRTDGRTDGHTDSPCSSGLCLLWFPPESLPKKEHVLVETLVRLSVIPTPYVIKRARTLREVSRAVSHPYSGCNKKEHVPVETLVRLLVIPTPDVIKKNTYR